MLKKARLLTRPTPARQDAPFRVQGRSKRRGEEVPAALRVGRSPLQWVLANGKTPTAFPTSEKLLLNVEPLSEARTMMADFFSILIKNHRPLRAVAKRAMVTLICQEQLLEHKNLATDMPRMQVTAIDQRIPLCGIEHVTGRNTDILGFARLQHHFGFHHKR